MTSQAEIVFRREWGRAVAVVTRLTGDLGLAEDAVQEAFASAVGRWTSGPLPTDPSGWLITVAKNHAMDRLRREARRSGKERAATLLLSQHDPAPSPGQIADDQLRLIFACCHPALDPGTRVALTLRTLCGLSTAEIARSFLVSEATLAQRLVRARRKIRAAGIPFRVPADEDLADRIDGVLRVVYLVFTEGHQASTGSQVIRGELCDEAVRLARLLAGLRPEDPEVLGLLALLLLTDARRDARAGERLVLLKEQDRSSWDHAKIDEGTRVLDLAARLGRPGPYQLQAAIAACHAAAGEASATDWAEIAALARRGLTPGEHAADTGYASADLLLAARARGITLLAPVPPDSSPQARSGGYTAAMFTIDWENKQVTCPQGAVSSSRGPGPQQGNQHHPGPVRQGDLPAVPGPGRCATVTGAGTRRRALRPDAGRRSAARIR